MNVAIATTTSEDTEPANNTRLHVARFDKSTRFGMPEICTNGIDDNCDGRTDCGDPGCQCVPAYLAGPAVVGCEGGFEPVVPIGAGGTLVCARPADRNAAEHHCEVPRGQCGGATVPAWCCELQTWSNTPARRSRASTSATWACPAACPATPTSRTRTRP